MLVSLCAAFVGGSLFPAAPVAAAQSRTARYLIATVGQPTAGAGEVWVFSSDGSVKRRYATDAGATGHGTMTPVYSATISWAPDGDRLVYDRDADDETEAPAEDRTLTIVNLPEGHRSTFETRVGLDIYPSWSADGSAIAWLADYDEDIFGQEYDLTVRPLSGGPARRLTTGGRVGGTPRWSPDGARLALTGITDADETRHRDVALVDVDDGEVRAITDDGRSEAPQWSPRGDQILYRSGDATMVMSPDGSGKRVVVRGGFSWAWSPDGTVLAGLGENGGISVVAIEGTVVRTIGRPPRTSWSSPAWLPDGRLVVGQIDDSNGRTSIVVMRADGSRRRTFECCGGTQSFGQLWVSARQNGFEIEPAKLAPGKAPATSVVTSASPTPSDGASPTSAGSASPPPRSRENGPVPASAQWLAVAALLLASTAAAGTFFIYRRQT